MSGARGLDRRRFLGRGLAAASTALLGGCNDVSDQPWVKRVLDSAETLTRVTQRALLSPSDLAREFSEARSLVGEQGQLVAHDLGHGAGVPGRAARIDGETTVVLEGLEEGIDGVDEPARLPHFLEQARGHAAAEDFREQPRSEQFVGAGGGRGPGEDEVRLFQLAGFAGPAGQRAGAGSALKTGA